MKRFNHYEAAFEAHLRRLKMPYVAVDETRRSLCGDDSLKSLDFIVSPAAAPRSWLVDVKGRRFPSAGKQYWRNWVTLDEIHSLSRWEQLFGRKFCSSLVFAYQVIGDQAPLPPELLFEFRGQLYGFVAVRLDHYIAWAKTLSVKWRTITMPAEKFRQFARPAEALFAA